MRYAIYAFATLSVVVMVTATISTVTPHRAAAQETTTIAVGDLWFCDSSFQDGVCETTISAGDTVAWNFSGAALPHTSTECGDSCDATNDSPLWNSGAVSDGSTFQFTFSEPGTYSYRCNIHPGPMRGQITVLAIQEEPTATPDASPPPDDSPPAPTVVASPDRSSPAPVVAAPPATGQGMQSEASALGPWTAAVLAAVGIGLAGLGAATLRRARRLG